jgi:hypothetical protein
MNVILSQVGLSTLVASFVKDDTVYNINLATLEDTVIEDAITLGRITSGLKHQLDLPTLSEFVILCHESFIADSSTVNGISVFLDKEIPDILIEVTRQYGYVVALHLNGIIHMALSDEAMDMETIRVPSQLVTVAVSNQKQLRIWTSTHNTEQLFQELYVASQAEGVMGDLIDLTLHAVPNLVGHALVAIPSNDDSLNLIVSKWMPHMSGIFHITFHTSMLFDVQVECMMALLSFFDAVNGKPVHKMKALTQLTTLN